MTLANPAAWRGLSDRAINFRSEKGSKLLEEEFLNLNLPENNSGYKEVITVWTQFCSF
jgi:hypothetical protein